MWLRRTSLVFLTAFVVTCMAPVAVGQEDASTQPADAAPKTTIDPRIPLHQLKILVKPLTKDELQVEADAWMALLQQKARQVAAARLGVQKTNEAIGADDPQAAEAAIKSAEAVKERVEAVAAATEKKLTESAQKELGIDESARTANGEAASPEPPAAVATAGGGDLAATAKQKKEQLLATVIELQEQRTALADRLDVVLDSLAAKGGDVDDYRNYADAITGIEIDTKDASATWTAVSGWVTSKEGGLRWALNFVRFLAILLVSYLAAQVIAAVVNWLLERKVRLSQLAEKLISRTIKNVILLIGFAIALTALEINITPILAAIGAAGFIIGFALQGTLSNFASGLMILIYRPFDEGDIVTAGGVTGRVDQMSLVSTTFRTFDNQTIHVPNNEIWGNVITNITANEIRRVDLEFGIGYDDDFEEAERIIREIVAEHPLVLDDPEPVVALHELGDSSVQIVCRPWARTSDWWTVKTEITRRVKQRFDRAGISIPFPQRDVHVYQHAPAPSTVDA